MFSNWLAGWTKALIFKCWPISVAYILPPWPISSYRYDVIEHGIVKGWNSWISRAHWKSGDSLALGANWECGSRWDQEAPSLEWEGKQASSFQRTESLVIRRPRLNSKRLIRSHIYWACTPKHLICVTSFNPHSILRGWCYCHPYFTDEVQSGVTCTRSHSWQWAEPGCALWSAEWEPVFSSQFYTKGLWNATLKFKGME